MRLKRWITVLLLLNLKQQLVFGQSDQLTLAQLLESNSCSHVEGSDGTVCTVNGTLVLSSLLQPLSRPLTIIGASSAATVLLQPNNPLKVAVGSSVSLANLTIYYASFSSPIDPASSLAWSGIVMLGPNSSLSVTGCSLSVDCPTWAALTSAVCDHGRAPGDSQVRGHEGTAPSTPPPCPEIRAIYQPMPCRVQAPKPAANLKSSEFQNS